MPIDLTRSILVVLIPGAVAVCPWLLFAVMYTDATLGYDGTSDVLSNAFVFAVVSIAGLTCESLGTRLEVRWDTEREKSYLVSVNWYAYLASHLEPEPIGYKYLSRLATMMYFELAMLVALLPFSVGTTLLIYRRYEPSAICLVIVAFALTVLIGWYFWWNAKTTHEVLCRTRRELNVRWDPENASSYRVSEPSTQLRK